MLSFTSKYQKLIAWFFLYVFCFEALSSVFISRSYAAVNLSTHKILPLIDWKAVADSQAANSKILPVEVPLNFQAPFPENTLLENTPADIDVIEGPGPTQPEMQAFSSVNGSNMVDLFSGDFSYNIPLLDVGGYPVSIGYQSGISMDQEASWVGLGWNVNPGTITRNLRGIPDDFNGSDSIRKITSIKDNKTIGVSAGGDVEVAGFPLSLGAGLGIVHNNYKGWGLEYTTNVSLSAKIGAAGSMTGGLSFNNSSQEGLSITPSISAAFSQKTADEKSGLDGSLSLSLPYNSRTGIRNLQMSAGVRQYSTMKVNTKAGSKEFNGVQRSRFSSNISFASPTTTPSISMPFTSRQYSFTGKIGAVFGIAHPSAYVGGYVSVQKIEAEDTLQALPAYGYLHFQDGNKTKNPLLDFNREKELMYRDKPPVPHIAVPFYTYDAFSITGEGTGGMFRAYRGDIGYVHDHFMRTKNISVGASVDVGIGNLVHAGVDVNESYSFTQNSAWLEENSINSLIAFKGSEGKYEGSYFRNPGEKSINDKTFYETLGGDDVVTIGLHQSGRSSSVIQATNNLIRYRDKKRVGVSTLTRQNTTKSERDKRSQVTSYLTAKEAAVVGLNKYIENYKANEFNLDNCITGASEADGSHGLAADYYANKDLDGYVYKKIEDSINFDWGTNGPTFQFLLPAPPYISIPLPLYDNFSMRWQGRLKAPVTGQYTITVTSDDGVRLWIEDSLLVNRWNDHPATADNVTLNLVEGQLYKIKMEYYENRGLSSIKLEWAYPGQTKQVIPPSAFYLPVTDGFTFNSNLELERRTTGYRKGNHISQIDVLNPDGRRYVYGIPVYNLKQKEATFSVDGKNRGNIATGLTGYQHGIDNTTANNKGQDRYFNSEEIPAYAHSFLLTGILSPDYVDVTGNGITDDDLGDAIKFKYSKVNGIDNPFKWRAPYVKDSVTFNEGLKTDSRDDKGSYTYGEKEVWYLHSIESKTMIATFVTESRLDQLAIAETGAKYNDSSAKRLKEINLYSKADFIKNGTNAKPIKTVHFDYSYELCKGYNKPVNDSGKLTLKRIWFTYNKNQKVRQNPYVFNYNSKNPNYDLKSYDRWGNYKNPLENPGSGTGNLITNAEYPYSLQDSTLAAQNAAAWALDSIYLPSGGSLKVTYESDDYAYVQNRRAMQLFKIAGLSNSGGVSDPAPRLYNGSSEHLYVYVKIPSPVNSKDEVYAKYLQGIKKLYFKLFVEMPTDPYGKGYEYVPCYANLDETNGYGIVSGQPNMLWVKITGVSLKGDKPGEYNPLAKAAMQFIRLNLPSKAYPGSQVGDHLDGEAAIKMILAMGDNIKNSFTTFDNIARSKGWASKIDTSRSFIRLNTPEYIKYGGGYRVKKITIYDNWDKMTGGREAVYGQEYIYKTVQTIGGANRLISSGVANWEPGIGGEENPFRQPIEYTEEISILGPVSMGYSEEPLGESLFPAPSIGYSKVRVRTLNHKNTRSANGYSETGFYTAYDFPVYTDRTLIDDDTKKRFRPSISNFLRINAKYYLGISQGFKIELNDMHGKMRYEAAYAESSPEKPISYTENIYRVENLLSDQKRLSNTVITMKPDGSIDTSSLVGKEVELMIDMREQLSVTSGNNTNVNADIFSVPFIPFFMVIPSFFRLPQREENKFRSAATTKIIQRYGILDSVIHIDKGSKISTRDLMYDAETGNVLLTRTQNEFDDPVYSFNYPAHWAYDGMGMAYKNIGAFARNVSFSKGRITGGLPVAEALFFSTGDELLVSGKQFTGTSGCTTFASFPGMEKVWAIDSAVSGGTSKYFFFDASGNPYTGSNVTIKVVRSGRRNLGGAVGAVTMLSNPLVKNGSQYELKIDDASMVVNASVNEFKDYWQVRDRKARFFDITYKDTIPADCSGDTSCTCKCLKTLFDYLIASKRLFIKSSQNITVGQIVSDANSAGFPLSVSGCDLLQRNEFKLFYARTTDSITNRYIAQIGDCIIKISSDNNDFISLYSLKSMLCSGSSKVMYADTLMRGSGDSCEPSIFVKSYGGSGTEELFDLKETFDGGYIMAGSTTSFGSGGKDGYIIKTDAKGNVLWSKAYGGSANDDFMKIRQTTDSGYIAIGTTRSHGQAQGEIFVVKTDSLGVVTWARGFQQGTTYGEAGYDIIQTSEGGYALAGIHNFVSQQSDLQVLKLNSSGNVTWARRFGGQNGSDNLGGIVEINDTLYFGGFGQSDFFVGSPTPKTLYDALIVKLNKTNGDIIWSKAYDLAGKSNWVSHIQPTSNGVHLDIINMKDYIGSDAYNVSFEVDRNGSPVKAIRLNLDSLSSSYATGSTRTFDGGYITGHLRTDVNADAIIQKVSAGGAVSWSNSIKKPGVQYLRQAIQSRDSSFAAVGVDVNDGLFIKTNKLGKTDCADSTLNYDTTSLPVTAYNVSLTTSMLTFSDANFSLTAQNAATTVADLCSANLCTGPNATLEVESCQSRDTIVGISCESVVKDTASNPFVTGILGNWRMDRSYAYYASREQSDPTADINLRTDGTIEGYAGFWQFDNGKLKPQYDTTRWVWNSRTTMFNQKGMEVENTDPLNRHNSALYGYNETLPIAVIQNSYYREAAFDGFEDYGFTTRLCDTGCVSDRHIDFSPYASKITTAEKHTGKRSLRLDPFEQVGLNFKLVTVSEDTLRSGLAFETGTDACSGGSTVVNAIKADSTIIIPAFSPFAGKQLLVSSWVKEEQDCNCSTYVYNQIRVMSSGGSGAEVILKPSGAIIEGWQRYEGVFTSAGDDKQLTLSLEATGNVPVYFDDLRIQPFNANMKSFIYNPVNLRLMAELDENNYSTFYEYDDDGTLIRVKKETERGIQTIKESRSALIKP